MPNPPLHVDYTKLPPTHPPRSFASWILLLAAWILGLIVWAVYLLAVAYLFLRVFG
jgi:hypothetical protein